MIIFTLNEIELYSLQNYNLIVVNKITALKNIFLKMFLLIFLYPCLHKSEQKYELGTTLIYLLYSETGIYLFIFISLSSNHSFSHIDILNTTPYINLGMDFVLCSK